MLTSLWIDLAAHQMVRHCEPPAAPHRQRDQELLEHASEEAADADGHRPRHAQDLRHRRPGVLLSVDADAVHSAHAHLAVELRARRGRGSSFQIPVSALATLPPHRAHPRHPTAPPISLLHAFLENQSGRHAPPHFRHREAGTPKPSALLVHLPHPQNASRLEHRAREPNHCIPFPCPFFSYGALSSPET